MPKILFTRLFLTLICFLVVIPHSAKASTTTKIVDGNGTGDYTSLEAALAARETDIYIKNGVYDVHTTLLVDYPNVTITGESKNGVILRQNNPEADLLAVKADYVTISNLTLDTQTYEAWAAFVESGANYVTVVDSRFLGSP
ncbi:hypothetical protein [Brevibacillus dissolubilis]|uniref:hypothetical protein n=1 Tax=Brevibacillus dissolubilis TaxID=1844116 RepID=UPI001116AAB6|nr:hypothetical protein [Brevibacillus dissolubilis]